MIKPATCPTRSTATILQLAALLLMLAPLGLSAGVFKWVDADGKVHYTDKPPPDAKAEAIKPITTTDPTTAKRLNGYQKTVDEYAEKRAEKKAEAAEDLRIKKENARKCADSRKQLSDLENSTRRRVRNAQGELEFVDEERRQKWMATARENIAKVCK